jgi:hypothetical protein
LIFAQAFDDLPYPNPDRPTYFQQEMTSLMRFQAANDINVPFFASFSLRGRGSDYSDDYLKSIMDINNLNTNNYLSPSVVNDWLESNRDLNEYSEGVSDMQFLLGGQIRINNHFYIPLFFSYGQWEVKKIIGIGRTESDLIYYDDGYHGYAYNHDLYYKNPLMVQEGNHSMFAGSGLFINTKRIQGGIYMGATSLESEEKFGFQIALIPLVKTSDWETIGWLLDNILGYLGMGDAVMSTVEEEGDSKISELVNRLNLGLELAFTRAHWGPFTLNAQAIYNRGNYDAAAKNDTYGAKVIGLFSHFPFGFTLEGGYKHFFAISQLFADDYKDTGYFSGSIFFPFKRITFGVLCQYDNVMKSQFGVAITTNFLSGFSFLKPRGADDKYKKTLDVGGGVRFRWGGWKANKKSTGEESDDK